MRDKYGELVCELCIKGERLLFLHHLTYKNLGKEAFADVKLVCDDCHQLAHYIYENTPQGVSLTEATNHVPQYLVTQSLKILCEPKTKKHQTKKEEPVFKELNKKSKFGLMEIGEIFSRPSSTNSST
jgi:hypothetical protein